VAAPEAVSAYQLAQTAGVRLQPSEAYSEVSLENMLAVCLALTLAELPASP